MPRKTIANVASDLEKFENQTIERLSALEERTSPKQKTFLEIIQDYGGIFALAIALMYSWPLGVWDRFIVGPKEREEEEVEEVRESLYDASRLSVELGKIQSAISDPKLRDLAGRSLSNQLLLILSKNGDKYRKYRNQLFPEELLMIGLMYQGLYRIEESLEYFEFAEDIGSSQAIELEIQRQIAKSYFLPSGKQDIKKARKIFHEAISKHAKTSNMEVLFQSIVVQSEWGFLEMVSGDWLCGTQNMDMALNRLERWQAFLNDQENFKNLLNSQFSSLKKRDDQRAIGCGDI